MNIDSSHLNMEEMQKDSPLLLPRGEIRVWFVNCTEHRIREKEASCLADEEILRARRFARGDDRQRFLLGHVVLKRLLGRYAGVCWRDVHLSRGAQGKPYWECDDPERAVWFNLSHSGECIALAFARDIPVGIDIEKIEQNPRADAVAKRFFHPRESAAVEGMPGDGKLLEFYRTWTRKEALLKGIGCGLTVPTESFYFAAVSGAQDEYRACGLDPDYSGWRVRTVRDRTGYEASVAYELPGGSGDRG